jgi:hypothetical protein
MPDDLSSVLVEYCTWKWTVGVPSFWMGRMSPWEYLDISFDYWRQAREAWTETNPEHKWARKI